MNAAVSGSAPNTSYGSERTLAGHRDLAPSLFVQEPGQLRLHPPQQPEPLVVLTLGQLADAGFVPLHPVQPVQAEVVLPVPAVDLLAGPADGRLDLDRIVPGPFGEFRNGREQRRGAGELALRADGRGELLQHGGVSVPDPAQGVLGGLLQSLGGGGIGSDLTGGEQILDQLGDVLGASAEPQRGVQLADQLLGTVRRHGPHPATGHP
ncbi:hypothetical protein [Streptomyces sp. NPDC085540]|uniref:hypothetical protein n=1 Tax=Streptomyces sp. NPDC085540 TaxID=3365730 RepID=UPI0037CEDE67